jgi:ribonuclease P protein component
MGTIKSSSEIDAIFRGAKRVAHPLLIVLAAHTPEGRGRTGRVAFIAGKKLGGAVLRNRCRRVMREAVRRVGGPWDVWDVVLIARLDTATAASSDLDAALKGLLDRGGIR